MTILTNNQRFIQDSYGGSPVIKESVLKYVAAPSAPQMVIYDVTSTELEYDDNLVISLEGITNEEETYFTVQE